MHQYGTHTIVAFMEYTGYMIPLSNLLFITMYIRVTLGMPQLPETHPVLLLGVFHKLLFCLPRHDTSYKTLITFIFFCYFLVVVDLSDVQSIDMAGTWRQDIINNVYLSDDSELVNQSKHQTDIKKSLPILLVGSKLDKVCQKLLL